jgi:hypothetical protein
VDDLWGGFGSGDAEVIACLVQQVEAYVGVDSGPGKAASSTDTPTLICWRKMHPMQFHDPAPNTVHAIPSDWRDMAPCENSRIAEWFSAHYQYLTYVNEHGLVARGLEWLARTLKAEDIVKDASGINFLMPNGIGDVMWALHKIYPMAQGRPVHITLSGDPTNFVDLRAVPFLRRFPWVSSVEVKDIPVLEDREYPTDVRGRYRYLSDGPRGQYWIMCPNRVLEAGRRLESWLAEHVCDWSVIDTFDWSATERGANLGKERAPFAAFYLGPETGNVDEGHNRGFLWEPKHWVELGKMLVDRGLQIVLVGAKYDRSYWERYVRPGVREQGMDWFDAIGEYEIGESLALIRQAKVFVSYQCGLGIVAHYLGVPTIMWWRPEGNSCHPDRLVSFHEEMRHGWTNPALANRYYGAVYLRESPQDLMRVIEERQWLKSAPSPSES